MLFTIVAALLIVFVGFPILLNVLGAILWFFHGVFFTDHAPKERDLSGE